MPFARKGGRLREGGRRLLWVYIFLLFGRRRKTEYFTSACLFCLFEISFRFRSLFYSVHNAACFILRMLFFPVFLFIIDWLSILFYFFLLLLFPSYSFFATRFNSARVSLFSLFPLVTTFSLLLLLFSILLGKIGTRLYVAKYWFGDSTVFP